MSHLPISLPAGLGGEEAPGPATPENSGVENLTTEEVLRRLLSPALKGRAWNALLKAIAVGDDYKKETIRNAYEQLWVSTADGKYLDARASAMGIDRPHQLGISDDNFRDLVISINAEKLTVQAIYQALEVLYGKDATRASATSIAEPYVLANGNQLVINANDTTYTVTFTTADFEDIAAAQALEVAEAINKQFRLQQSSAFAEAWNNPDTGLNYVRIYSGHLGLEGYLQILGGQAQNVLLFPSLIDLDAVGTEWTITKDESVLRFEADVDPGLSDVVVGDYVNLYGTEFNSNNRGNFIVTDVSVGNSLVYFEIENISGVAQTVTQLTTNALRFYRPDKLTITNDSRMVSVVQALNSLSIKIPATTVVVNREPLKAAYLASPDILTVSSLSRTSLGVATLSTSTPHNLSIGDWFIAEGIVVQAAAAGAGGINGIWKVVSTPSPTSLTFVTENKGQITSVVSGGSIMAVAAEENDEAIGPYLLDPKNDTGLTGVTTTTTMDIEKGYQYNVLTVADASDVPDEEGWLAIALGYTEQAIPVPYKARLSSTQILLDYSYTFPEAIDSGASVIILTQKGSWTPDDPETAGLAYITASNAGLTYSKAILELITKAGSNLLIDVAYPGDHGLGAAGFPETGTKLTDAIWVWGSDSLDAELEEDR